jgi:aryl-alcohol dehydrogenase-like predicted oxidoreductase
MHYRPLGKSLLRVSVLAFGCMSLGEETEANTTLVHRALDLGINFFDTADMYKQGANEKTLGTALKARRKEAILATKVGNQWRSDGSGWNWNPRKAYILQALEESLTRLQTDYIDLYQLHGGTIDDPIDETIEAFEILQSQGKIRYYGISSIRPNVIREYVHRSGIVSVMMQYSMLDRRPEESCLSLLKTQEIGVLVRGALAQGLLVDKPAVPYLNHSAAEVQQAADTIQTMAPDPSRRAAIPLLFALRDPAVCAVVAGIRSAVQLESLIQGLELQGSLTMDQLDKLEKAVPKNYYELHR